MRYKVTLAVLRALVEAASGRIDPRFLGSAQCNSCCPLANLQRLAYPGTNVSVYVEYTKVGTQRVPHDNNVQTVVRAVDAWRKGTPISLGVLLDIIQGAEDLTVA